MNPDIDSTDVCVRVRRKTCTNFAEVQQSTGKTRDSEEEFFIVNDAAD